MRILDFTVCTTKCTIPCWHKLTKEEEEWLKNNPNRTSYADFDYANKTVEELDVCAWFKSLCDKNKFFAWSYYPYGA